MPTLSNSSCDFLMIGFYRIFIQILPCLLLNSSKIKETAEGGTNKFQSLFPKLGVQSEHPNNYFPRNATILSSKNKDCMISVFGIIVTNSSLIF